MAFWGAPIEMQNHATAACLAALKAQARIAELNREWAAASRPVFATRIGINTGEVIVGNMGSEQRLNYTVIGDPVNLASRLEGINKSYKTRIIISQNTYERCKDDIEARILDFTTVKGKSEVVTIYELIAEKGDISAADKEFIQKFGGSRSFTVRASGRRPSRASRSSRGLVPSTTQQSSSSSVAGSFRPSRPPRGWTGIAA